MSAAMHGFAIPFIVAASTRLRCNLSPSVEYVSFSTDSRHTVSTDRVTH